jgi:glycosyltransferase involved in cell wall biosynthesis
MRGTAVVASSVGGLGEIVEHGRTGFLVPPGDPGALAESLLVLARDRALAERMGRAGREVALRRYREDAFVERIVSLYHEVLR